MARVAVVGAGAIGGYVAAALSDRGHLVDLCVRTAGRQRPRLELASGTYLPAMRVVGPDDRVSPVDWVVLTTKAHDSAGASGWFHRLCGPDTVVVVMQNGVDHRERVEPLIPRGRVLPCLVYVAAERLGPHRIAHRGGTRIVLPDDSDGRAFADLVNGHMLSAELVADFHTAAWRKLLANVVANPITAITGQRMGVLSVPEVRDLARGLLAETVASGVADGARLSEADVGEALRTLGSFGPETGTSMLADRMAGRRLEDDLIPAAVVRAAERHGVEVPLTRAVLALLRSLRPLEPVGPARATSASGVERAALAA